MSRISSDLAGWRIENQQSAALKKNSIALRWDCVERQFYSFSGTTLIFSQAGTSVAFLWVPFPLGILLTFGKENIFSLLSLNRKILLPPKEMEQNKIRILQD